MPPEFKFEPQSYTLQQHELLLPHVSYLGGLQKPEESAHLTDYQYQEQLDADNFPKQAPSVHQLA